MSRMIGEDKNGQVEWARGSERASLARQDDPPDNRRDGHPARHGCYGDHEPGFDGGVVWGNEEETVDGVDDVEIAVGVDDGVEVAVTPAPAAGSALFLSLSLAFCSAKT